MASRSQHIIDTWLAELQAQEAKSIADYPSYYVASPEELVTTSRPATFSIGTGARILSSVFPACLEAEHELIIVTCFWAKSASQQQLADLLQELSAKAIARKRKIQVRLCFSSSSIWQKLTQTSSLDGQFYPPSSWEGLGLPSPAAIPGIEMLVKSVFVRPFSVMHPKFILVDRKLAFMPSCNVSWEDWFEGCVEMRGEICGKLFGFWEAFWSRGSPTLPQFRDENEEIDVGEETITSNTNSVKALLGHSKISHSTPITTILLPSPHHQNPRFKPHSSTTPPVPPTPLNIFLLHILNSAQKDIYLQTPNLTAKPVIYALLSALERGINIELVTSSILMIFEQLGTAGTITEFEIWKLRRRYLKLCQSYEAKSHTDPELQTPRPGTLKIGYYNPRPHTAGNLGYDEPAKSHLKLTIVDDEIVVLGSGNMDRASFYTSQELGIAFFSKDLATVVKSTTVEALQGRGVGFFFEIDSASVVRYELQPLSSSSFFVPPVKVRCIRDLPTRHNTRYNTPSFENRRGLPEGRYTFFRSPDFTRYNMGNPFKRPSKELVRPAPVASTQDTRSMNRTLGPTRIGKKTGERHGPLTKFEVFGRLPPEIRVKIWKEACHAPRAVEIMRREEDSEGSKFPHRNLPPAVLEVNREARNEGLRLYNTFFSSAVYPAYKSYINWNVDYLFLQKEPNEDCQAELIPARGYFDHMAVKKCPRIAILASDTFWFLTWFLDAKDERGNAPEELVEFRQRLQTLMIIENGNPAYYKGEGIKYMGLRDQGDIDETDSRNVVSDFHLLRTLSFEEIVELVPNLVDNIRKHLSNVEVKMGRVEWQSEDPS
ncbi:Phospholipase D/nuclease [Glarea lozoyensis ATCC 20868]|uniref:Phospholipase D/nuclease n=1 Tax=Glarea lozoyensis (strain ATCC 20868 / MF5171) TaxID=1116229 RepID=S3DYR5_GLAL2|nr:Phospholipase D/nuclease [Glarea lozoyensis ATCC 20868]EPE37081.1 Phospholipase D/nuclease [Glarea lozoyensis ATCC 20868]